MKNKLNKIVPAIVLAGVILWQLRPVQAQQHQRQTQHATVLFSTYEGTGGTVKIYPFSAFGPGVPEFTNDAAEYITKLRDAGFEQQQAEWGYMFLR